MNKMLRVSMVFALACLMIISSFGMAFAADSKTADSEVTKIVDASGAEVTFDVKAIDSSIPPLTEKLASPEVNVPEGQLEVIWQQDVVPAKDSKAPYTLTFNAGAKGQTVYAFHWNGSKWEYIDKGTGSEFSITFPELSPVGLVVEKDATTPSGKSDKTGENALPLCIAFAAVILGGTAAGMALKRR